MSRYEEIQKEISRIQFHTDLSPEEKNKQISRLEKILAKEEQKDLDGKGGNFY